MRVKQKAIPLLLAVLVAVGALCCGVAFRSPRQGVSAAEHRPLSAELQADFEAKFNRISGETERKNFYVMSNITDTIVSVPFLLPIQYIEPFNKDDTSFFAVDYFYFFRNSSDIGPFPGDTRDVFTERYKKSKPYSGNGVLYETVRIAMNTCFFDLNYFGSAKLLNYKTNVPKRGSQNPAAGDLVAYNSDKEYLQLFATFAYQTQYPVYMYLVFETVSPIVTFSYINEMGTPDIYRIEVPFGHVLTESEIFKVPSVPHMTFSGWDYPLDMAIKNDITFTARYTGEKYSVLYYDRFGDLWETRNIEFGKFAPQLRPEAYSVMKDNELIFYDFVGWSMTEGDTSLVDLSVKKITGDLSLYPIYKLRDGNKPSGGGSTDKPGDGDGVSWWDKLGAWKLWGWNAGKTAQGLLIVVFIIVGIIAAIYLVKFISWIVDAFATMKMKRDIRKLNREKRRGGY